MMLYETMISIADSLVEKGHNSPPGIREKLFTEANEMRDKADDLTIEEGEDIAVHPSIL